MLFVYFVSLPLKCLMNHFGKTGGNEKKKMGLISFYCFSEVTQMELMSFASILWWLNLTCDNFYYFSSTCVNFWLLTITFQSTDFQCITYTWSYQPLLKQYFSKFGMLNHQLILKEYLLCSCRGWVKLHRGSSIKNSGTQIWNIGNLPI